MSNDTYLWHSPCARLYIAVVFVTNTQTANGELGILYTTVRNVTTGPPWPVTYICNTMMVNVAGLQWINCNHWRFPETCLMLTWCTWTTAVQCVCMSLKITIKYHHFHYHWSAVKCTVNTREGGNCTQCNTAATNFFQTSDTLSQFNTTVGRRGAKIVPKLWNF